jgi:hypothetical protein
MTFNSNIFNAIELTEADLDCVSGGDAANIAVNPIFLKAKEELEAAYQRSHPINLGSFPPPHIAVPQL